jgi:hypothetical protein
MKDSDKESGFRWWARYVIVPIIGGGGLIALMVAYVERPHPIQVGNSANQVAKPDSPLEKVTFYASSKLRDHDDQRISVNQFETVLIHWDVQNPRGKLFLRTLMLDGLSNEKEIDNHGFERLDADDTVDYFLEEEDSQHHRLTLGSLRVSVVKPF